MTDLVTAKGKKFDSGFFVEHSPSKSIYFTVVDVPEETVRKVFSDPTETCRMEYNGRIYEDFTTLDYITKDDENVWKLRMMRCNQ